MIRVGIAGIGAIAEEYIRLVVNGKITGCEICAFSSRNTLRMREICSKYDLSKTEIFTDYEEMLSSGKIDMVIICTPHYLHPTMAIQAVEAGIHPLIEKPVGIYADEVEQLLKKLAERTEIKSGVLYCRRTSSAFRKMKEIMLQGGIGEMKRANWLITNLYRTQAYHDSQSWRGTYKGEGGGLMMTQASHQLDLMMWLCSLPKRVHAFCYCGMERNIEVENDVTIQMEYQNGATAQFIASSREFPGTNRLEIIGNKGQLILENDSELIYRKLAQDERIYSATTSELFGKIPYQEEKYYFNDVDNHTQQAAIINNFINAIDGKEEVLCSVEEAVKSLYVINAAYLSSWKQKAIDIPFDGEKFRVALQERF